MLILRVPIVIHASDLAAPIHNVPDIQSHIWCYLAWEERLILRLVSTSCNRMHRHLYPKEQIIIAQFMELSLKIHTIDPHELIEFFRTKRFILDGDVVEKHDAMLIEKIMVDITERAPSFPTVFRACNIWLKSFKARYPPFYEGNRLPSDLWPDVDGDGSVIPCFWNLDRIQRVFRMANNEMIRTKSKYNRYTRFSFVFLDSFLLSLEEMSSNIKNKIKGRLWNEIVSVEFISDYLQRPRLRNFSKPAAMAIELIMADAVGVNGSVNYLNTDRLLLMVHHPRILFNFNVIFPYMKSRIWSHKTRIELLHFIVNHGLMTWSMIWEQMRIRSMSHYVWFRYLYDKSRHLHALSMTNNSKSPLLTKNVVRSAPCKAKQNKDDCCPCM